MSINMIRVDEIRICFQCKGEGFVEYTDYNSLERVVKKFEQCDGSGLLKLTGNIKISSFIACNRTCQNDQSENIKRRNDL